LAQCAQCGREMPEAANGGDLTCEECRQREFAAQAEEAAWHNPSRNFVVTNTLLAINIAVYLWMVLFRHVSPTSPGTDQVIHFGGNFGPLTLSTEPWRLVTAMFVHIGFLHLLANMMGLFVLGRLAESLYGRWAYLATYFLAGIAGSFGSILWNPLGVSAGASGAIFGIAGALIATFLVGKLPLPKESIRYLLFTLVAFAGFDLLYGVWKEAVDNAAHFGGLFAGLLLGLLLGHHLGPSPSAKAFRERLLFAALLVLVLFGGFVWRKDSYVADVERARLLIARGGLDEAIRQLEVAVSHRPNEAYLLNMLGEAYTKKGNFPKAEQEYRRVTELKPNDPVGWTGLAQTLGLETKFADSAAAWVKAAELSKKNAAAAPWFAAGQTYAVIDKQEEAIKAYQKALALSPNAVEVWAAMGFAQLKAGQNQQAVTSLEKAVKLQPGNADFRLILGNAYLAVGKQDQAQEEFFQASKIRAAIQERLRQMQKTQIQKPGAAAVPQAAPSPATPSPATNTTK